MVKSQHGETYRWLTSSSWVDPSSDLNQVSNKTLKNIGPPSKPEGNEMHKGHSEVSPRIDFMGDYNTHVFAF